MTPEEKFQRRLFKELAHQHGAAKAAEIMASKAPPVDKDPGAFRSTVLGVAQGGVSDFTDEIGGIAGSMKIGDGPRLTPQAKAELVAKGQPLPDDRGGRELTRDNIRDEDRRAQKFHPGKNMAGRVGGGIAAAYLLPGGAPKSIAGMMGTGAGYGALTGLGSSEADLEKGEYGRAAVDTGIGAGTGLVLSGLAGVGLKKGPGFLDYLSETTRQGALNKGRNVLLNGADQLSNNKALPEAVVLRALNEGHIKPFGTTQGAATRLEKALAGAGDDYGAAVDKLHDLGATGPDVLDVASAFSARSRELAGKSGDPRIPKLFADEAEKALNTAANNEVASVSGRMPLRDAEFYKRDLQNLAKYGKVKAEETPLNPYRKEAASLWRQSIEDEIAKAAQDAGKGSALADVAATFVPVKTRYGELAQALAAAEKGVARGSQRTGSMFQPDAMALGQAIVDPSQAPALLAKPTTGLLKGRLPSTLAVGGMAVSDLLRAMSKGAGKASLSGSTRGTIANAAGLSADEAQTIVEWLRRKNDQP